jgi:hypothetical protein
MAFSKSFPKRSDKSIYPVWEDVYLSFDEEKQAEESCRLENIKLFQECVSDARKIIEGQSLKDYQSDIISIAVALFEKRASHAVYWKENLSKEKFDQKEGLGS